MNNQLIPFDFEENEVRVIVINGEPWFVAKDVALALKYPPTSNPARLFSHVPEEWRGVKPIHTRSENGVTQSRDTLCVSEQGLYFFLGRSDKDKALPFQKKVAGEVVPQIMRRGSYSEARDSSEFWKMAEGFMASLYLEEENKRLRREIRRYETRNFLTAGDKIDILTLRVREYPVSAIQKITKKGRKRIQDFIDGFLALPEEEADAELKSWYEAVEGKGGAA
jgi:prophage antirepressor-like protein